MIPDRSFESKWLESLESNNNDWMYVNWLNITWTNFFGTSTFFCYENLAYGIYRGQVSENINDHGLQMISVIGATIISENLVHVV